jgi:hypothetical protein
MFVGKMSECGSLERPFVLNNRMRVIRVMGILEYGVCWMDGKLLWVMEAV